MMMMMIIYLLLQLQHNYILYYIYIYFRVRLPSADQLSIIDKNKGTCCVETQNKYCFKCLALLSIRKSNLAHVSHRQLFEKKNY